MTRKFDSPSPVPFGWHGLEFAVPPDWELAAYGGNRAAGYASLDDGERVRLRVQWQNSANAPPELSKTVERYRRLVRKQEGVPTDFETLERGIAPKRFRQGKETCVFRWLQDPLRYGVAWKCKTCRRTVLMETVVPEGVDGGDTVRTLLSSARDHAEDDWALWAVYGFAFRMRSSYNLENTQLHSGHLLFSFRQARHDWVNVERWGMAHELLRRVPFEAWPEELLTRTRLGGARIVEREEAGADGCCEHRFMAEGRRKGFLSVLSRPLQLEGVVRSFPEEDKIVTVLAAGPARDCLGRVMSTVRCR